MLPVACCCLLSAVCCLLLLAVACVALVLLVFCLSTDFLSNYLSSCYCSFAHFSTIVCRSCVAMCGASSCGCCCYCCCSSSCSCSCDRCCSCCLLCLLLLRAIIQVLLATYLCCCLGKSYALLLLQQTEREKERKGLRCELVKGLSLNLTTQTPVEILPRRFHNSLGHFSID